MAIATYELFHGSNAAGQPARVVLEYDDQDMRATGLRVVNGSDDALYAEVARTSDGTKHSAIFLPHTDTIIPIPYLDLTRIDVQWHHSGELIGFTSRILFPAP